MKAIEIKDLVIAYPGQSSKAVDRLTLSIEPGEFFGLLGPNGAGKTSVISALSGLVATHSGFISILAHSPGSAEAKRALGLVPQEVVSYGFFNVEEILEFTSGYFGLRSNKKRIDELLERLQLAPMRKKLVAQLSGGMKRRLLIARSLLHSPQILLLDEPSAGVDVELRTILWDFAEELNRAGTTIILTTHYLEEAERLCNRVAIMNRGKLLAVDETGTLIKSMAERAVSIRLKAGTEWNPPPIESIDFRALHREGDQVRVVVSSKVSLQDLIQRLNLPLDAIADLTMEESALENAFLKLVRKSEQSNG